MGSSEEEIMVNLLQAQQTAASTGAAAAITTTTNNLFQQSLKPLFSSYTDYYESLKKPSQHLDLLHFPSSFPTSHFFSSSSPSNLWDVGEGFQRGKNGVGDDDDENDDGGKLRLRVSSRVLSTSMKIKRIKGRKKVREPRFSFKTMSDVDVLDDGYKWRKYGQKVVKNTLHPRSYYRCTQNNCRVKKRVERLAEDPRMVITTYEGRHAHSPSPDNLEEPMGQLPSSHLNNFLW